MCLFKFYANFFQECKPQGILHITFFQATDKTPSYPSKKKYDHLFPVTMRERMKGQPVYTVVSLIAGIWEPNKTRILVYFTKCGCGH